MDTAFIKKTRRTARWEWLILHKAILKYRRGSFAQGFYRPQIYTDGHRLGAKGSDWIGDY